MLPPAIRRIGIASPLLAAWIVPAVACRSPEPPAVIGYGYRTEISAPATVGTIELERAHAAGAPRILIRGARGISGETPGAEVRRAEALAAMPGVVAVVGHGGSRGSLAAAPIYNAAGIPHVAPTSTSRRLTDIGEWTFVLAPDDSVEGEFIASFANAELGARSVTIFSVTDEYGSGLRDGVARALARRNIRIVDQVTYELDSDLELLVRATLARGRPDAVVIAGRSGDASRLNALLGRYAPGVRVVAGDGALILPMSAESDSMYVVAFWLPDPANPLSRRFVAEYQRVSGRVPGSGEALTHDALMVVAAGIGEVGPDRAALREWLASLGRTRPPYRGVTGMVAFGRERADHLIMTRMRGGLPERVWLQ